MTTRKHSALDGALVIEMTSINTLGAQIVKDEFRSAISESAQWQANSAALTVFSTLVVCHAHTVNIEWLGDELPPAEAVRLLAYWKTRAGKSYRELWDTAQASLTWDELDLWWSAYTATRETAIVGAPPELQVTQDEAQEAGEGFLAATE